MPSLNPHHGRPFGRLALALALSGCAATGDAAPPARPPAVVEVAALSAQQVPLFDTYIGSVRSRSGSELRSQVTGRVTEIGVRAGQEVEAGTVLMRIDQSRQRANLDRARAATAAVSSELQRARADLLGLAAEREAAQSQLQFARKQRERVRALFAANNTSRETFERTNSELDAAEASLAAVQAQQQAQQAAIGRLQAEVQQSRSSVNEGEAELAYYNVQAPIAGRLGDVPVRVGDLVTQNALLTTIEGNELREVYVQVPVDQSPRLRPDLELELVDTKGDVLERLKLSFIAPQVDPLTQTVLVKATLGEDTSLQPGQYVRTRVIWDHFEGPVVPPSAVRRINDMPFVFVVQKGEPPTVSQRAVQLGALAGQQYIVEDGLKLGDEVVTAGIQRLMDGVPVAVKPPPSDANESAQAHAEPTEAP